MKHEGISIDSRRGRVALLVAHCAGMVDLVALPVWIGVLVTAYGFDPQQAGALATLFLAGVVVASVVLAPRLPRVPGRFATGAGFALAAAAFFVASTQTAFGPLAVLHAIGGGATGAALSATHGTIARSARPHRLFAAAGIALGVFAVAFLAATPQIVARAGGPALFVVFGAVMAAAALACAIGFPTVAVGGRAGALPPSPADRERAGVRVPANQVPTRLSTPVWFGIAGIACMTVLQAMTFAFLERAGADRGFERQAINGVLIALGLVNLLPAALAMALEKRWPARRVMLAGPVLQALLAATIMNATSFPPYAAAASVFAAVMIFTHTFAFGLLATLEPSGRALAATPAMLMAGSAVGPLLGGTLVKAFGYGSLGIAAVVLGTLAVICFSRLPAAAGTPRAPKEVLA